jgi:hypothetical protein
MSRQAASTPEWQVRSTFVPKRDGGQRVEAAIRLLLAPPDTTQQDRRTDDESRHLRPRLDPPAGPGPDD